VRFTKYYLGDEVKEDGWSGHVTRMGEIRNAYRTFVVKPESKRPFEKPRSGWKFITKMILGK